MTFEHIDLVPETAADYHRIADVHEAAANRFADAQFVYIADEYRQAAMRNRVIALRLERAQPFKQAA